MNKGGFERSKFKWWNKTFDLVGRCKNAKLQDFNEPFSSVFCNHFLVKIKSILSKQHILHILLLLPLKSKFIFHCVQFYNSKYFTQSCKGQETKNALTSICLNFITTQQSSGARSGLAGMFFKVGNLIRNFFDNNWARGKQNYSTTEQKEENFSFETQKLHIPNSTSQFQVTFLPTSPILLRLKMSRNSLLQLFLFSAVQSSSIGDLVTHSLSDLSFDSMTTMTTSAYNS